MKEIQGRITVSRHAVGQEVKRGNSAENVEHRWYLWITRLYSCVNYREGEYKIETNGSEEKVIYNLQKTAHPMHKSSLKEANQPRLYPNNMGHIDSYFPKLKFYIAVKELIIEWEDYQAEVAGYVYCQACEDPIDKSDWFNHENENSDENKYENPNDSKQLLRFVKSPGLKTTSIKIGNEDLVFLPIELKNCEVKSGNQEEYIDYSSNKPYLQVRREHHLDCEIRPLFDATQRLPIKHAHITVEIHLQ